MTFLYDELRSQARQSSNGAWDNGGKIRDADDIIYSTVRGLQACHAMEEKPEACANISRAHRYLVQAAQEDPPLVTLKACVNALEAYQELFRCHLQPVNLYLVISLTEQLKRLGLSRVLLEAHGDPEETLVRVRTAAKRTLESRGRTALEPLGVNACLYDDLSQRDDVLNEFLSKPVKRPSRELTLAREKLYHFLSASMTEVRCDLARELIQDLWAREHLFNFRAFIMHLSDLEAARAFYTDYRDHVNHQVLFFLLGAYVYYHCPSLRSAVDREILQIDEKLGIQRQAANKERAAEAEFLFRLKLIATFHDVGYLFEVEPSIEDKDVKRVKRNDFVAESLQVVESFRTSFVQEYLLRGLSKTNANINTLASTLALKVRPYEPSIDVKANLYQLPMKEIKEIFKLNHQGLAADPFWVISSRIEGPRIGKELVERYFDLCRKTPLNFRLEYLDHGIMSALVLLKACDIQRHYLTELPRLVFQESLLRDQELVLMLNSDATKRHLDEGQFYVRFAHVAAASALHNIYPQQYTLEECRAFGLSDAFYDAPENKRFKLSLEDNALSYLAALVDALQDWDRHSFRAPAFADKRDRKHPIAAAEVLIEARDGKIHIVPLSKNAAERYGKQVKQMRETLADSDRYVTLTVPDRFREQNVST